MEDKIVDVLNALAGVFQDESDKEHFETVKKLIEDNHYLDIKKPEMFGLLVSTTLDHQKDLMARIALANVKIDAKKFDDLAFVYTHYEFMERHLDRVIVAFEGFACSADKTRWLLDTYAAYIISEELPVVEKEHYWHPNLLEIELWMKWMKSFQSLYYGNEENYVEIKQIIKEKYQEINKAKSALFHQRFTADDHFVAITEEEKRGETKTVYHFVDAVTKDKGAIIVDSIAETSYRFFFEKEQRFAKYGDTLPPWFESLNALN